jgi:hypothetical protein
MRKEKKMMKTKKMKMMKAKQVCEGRQLKQVRAGGVVKMWEAARKEEERESQELFI